MIRTVLAAAALFLVMTGTRPAAAQQGTISYDNTVKVEIELPPQMAHMQDQIPDSRTMKRALHFTETESVMKDSPEQQAAEDERQRQVQSEIQARQGNATVMFRAAGSDGPEEILYTSLETEDTIERRNFMGRTFLINGLREPIKWRLSGEQSEFEGYLTMKAVATVDSSSVEAWFTPQIPLPIGPDEYGGLPGAILVLTIDGGKQTWTATSIDLEATPEIKQPENGREVTREEYDAIVEEKMKELQAQRGGRGNTFEMRINN